MDKRYENRDIRATGSADLAPLAPEKLYTRCDPAQFEFRTTDDLEPVDPILGQPRATAAIRFGIGMQHDGYNLYALGPSGIGKRDVVRRFIEERAAAEASASDLCYVHNFAAPHRPLLLALPAGVGVRLRRDIDRLLEDMSGAVTAAFESDEYRTRLHKLEEELKTRHQRPFEEIGQEAQAQDIALLQTPGGFAFAPIRKGEALTPEAFRELPEEERKRIQDVIAALEERLQQRLEELPKYHRRKRERERELERDVSGKAVRHLIDELRAKYADFEPVLKHLAGLEEAIVDNADDFRRTEEQTENPFLMLAQQQAKASLRRYRVNVLVDRTGAAGAPVVYEDNPTYHNLVGRIEYAAQLGAMTTDFTLIKAGALHRANGGYLIVEARKLLMQPFAWEALKRALGAHEIRIEELGEMLSVISTVSLEPQPAPLRLKVVVLGDRFLYYLLCQLDPDFADLFKVAADFEDDMARDGDAQSLYARLIATLARKEKLLAFDRNAVARAIEHGARLAEDAQKLSLRTRELADVLREADYWARAGGRGVVTADDVQHAIDAKVGRLDRVRTRLQDEIARGVLLVETGGARVGQVNGLSVAQLGDFVFGYPTRITARVRLGKGEVLDIQREVKLGGPIHSKGVLILCGWLGARYVRDRPLSMSASLVFEQTYAEVEGDSASCAELYALISALADVPLKQSLAVTGSIDQHGDVQAIGGVNEKIEGFFDACQRRGSSADQGVIIPAANVRHLMLRADVVEAAANGKFGIFAIDSVDQGIELLTGLPAGNRDGGGAFPEGSVNYRVEARLLAMANDVRRFVAHETGDGSL